MYAAILKVLTCIGIIPTTRVQMHIVNVITALFSSLAITLISLQTYLSETKSDTRGLSATAIFESFADIVFFCIGAICPYLNFNLQSSYSDTLRKQDLRGPVWPKLLFVIIFMMIVTTFGYMTNAFVSDDQKDFGLQKIIYLSTAICYIIAILLMFSHLFFFGCCLRDSKIQMIDAVPDMDECKESDDKKCANICNNLLKLYKQTKESVSFGLFLMFTLITIASIFFIFISINSFGKYHLFLDSCNIFWCMVFLLLLVYLGLASDEADQARLNLIENMWTVYVAMSDSSRPELMSVIFKFQLIGPLSAEGFYDVNRGLLVALTGTLLTYIIILVQMREMFQ